MLFQEIEGRRHICCARAEPGPAQGHRDPRAIREANIAKRRDDADQRQRIPNLHETNAAVLEARPIELAPYGEAKFRFDPLSPMRLAAPFEALRDDRTPG